MRLIDADALKEQFREGAYTIKGIREEIDNAPTVEPTITCKECDGYEAGYSAGQHDARPKGKWLILNGDKVCPFCMTGTSHNTNASISFFQFCPYCGADMRVKDELNELEEAENEL